MTAEIEEEDKQPKVLVKKIFKNFSLLTIGKIAGDLFTFLLFVVLSRKYGQEGIGHYSFAIGFTGFFAAVAEFGLYHFSIKEMSRYQGPLGEYYGKIFALRIVLSLSVLLVLFCVLPFLPFSHESKVVIGLIGIYQVSYTLLEGFAAVFIAGEDMRLSAALEFSLRVVIALIGIGVALGGGSLTTAIMAFPVMTLLQIIAAHYLASRQHGAIIPVMSLASFKQVIRECSTYALARVLFILSARIDVIFLGFYLGAAAVGLYNVSYRMVFLFLVITHFASVSIFPQTSRLYLSSVSEFGKFYQKAMNFVVLVSIPLSCCLWLVAPEIITIFFGPAFVESIPVLRILAALLFLALTEGIVATFLMSCEQEKDRTIGYWVAACSNLLGTSVLVPLYGIQGAAVATLCANLAQVGYYFYRLQPRFGWPRVGGRLVVSGAVCLALCVPYVLPFSRLSLLRLPLALLLGGATLALFKDIREGELQMLCSMIRGFTGKK